jgi:hypothetical protein
MADTEVRGTTLRGDEPKRLELSDGSRLLLDGETPDGRPVAWRRIGRERGVVSVPDASRLAGEEFADYVAVRTRAEVEWLRAMSDWYREQAARLQAQLAEAVR